MRIRFKALSPTTDEDLGKTRPEGPAARQRASDTAPRPKPGREEPTATRSKGSTPVEGRPRKDGPKAARGVRRLVEPPVPEPKRRDPRRD